MYWLFSVGDLLCHILFMVETIKMGGVRFYLFILDLYL